MAPVLLEPGVAWGATIVEPGPAPVLSIAAGSLPVGLELDATGRLAGVPLEAGSVAAFTVASDDEAGRRLESGAYELAVGAGPVAVGAGPLLTPKGDVAAITHRWAVAPERMFVWDEALRWAWPLAAGPVLEANVLASPGGALSLHVAGPGGAARYELPGAPADGESELFVRMVWSGSGDLDLRCVVADGPELTGDAPVWSAADGWLARHAVQAADAPGGEGLVMSSRVPTGRYALVAVKAAGNDARFDVRTSVRLRDGTVLFERQERVLVSDIAQGTMAEERAEGRQSWGALGVIERGPEGDWRVRAPAYDGDPLAVETPR